ncbi:MULTISPECIES: AIPR family protein [unclassified Campylobacter]|uniref:AIPR family protein n=1 Tax=unclassified Campylobacter TaxID=2593542 RepID=UPI0022E9A0AB|nr:MULTISPECIES: AIPR family protein [unclassified Campylobacter]MDA3042430.1 AIPR family protein [Campylobacter sp. JMF_09 ED2]MDA3044756.1 AIPR family protein [Campylobacter sp. JMF_07 ED4]MDA3063122.1 AIPR family protein [Campylobacter sp. JMF_11 EL3]MDA3071733.1 AIPR family protein [Campylobacter sp. VBCF_03 NA9]MDA3074203.1 AIPR family protein [Campylobacter sp. JMF_05 ED3]
MQKIFLHFNAANDKKNTDSQKNIDSFNITTHPKIKAHINAKYHTISDIYDLYYGKNYKNNTKFTYNLKTFNKGTFAALKEEYGIGNGICEPYYIIAPITEIYKMYKEAGDYPLFEENIREYLGVGSKTSVNNGIIRTLQDPEERKNFLYYNNGITITCSEIKTDKMEKSKRILPLIQPQIVNGCQTVNSIVQVLDNYNEEEIENEFSSTYIMVKALVIPNLEDEVNNNFAKNVVRYTNRQNAVSDKAFATNHDKFYRLQDEFKKRGFVLLVKPSDKIKYKDFLKNNKDKLINKAKKYADEVGYINFKFADLSIDLEKLLQVYLALREDGYKAYVYKPEILKQSSEIYNKYSINIDSDLSIDNMIKLYLFYKKAEFDQKQNGLEKTPIPYYVIGFLNYFLSKQSVSYKDFFEQDVEIINIAYDCLASITSEYKEECRKAGIEYNNMIKTAIKIDVLEKVISTGERFGKRFPKIEK